MRKKMAIFLAVIIALDVIALGVIFFTRNSSRPDISADAAPGADQGQKIVFHEMTSLLQIFKNVRNKHNTFFAVVL